MKKLDYSKRKPNGLYVGATLTNKYGDVFEVVEYISSRKVKCKFVVTGYETPYSQAGNVVRGVLKDLMKPTIEGVGFVGGTDAPVGYRKDPHPVYNAWRNMFIRCYSDNYHKTRPTYIGCSVDPRWHNYQVFYKWGKGKFREGYHLDKDILCKGNKVYSPETCCFVPQEINMLVTDNKSRRGDCPIGVSKRKKKGTQEYNGLLTVTCSVPFSTQQYLGRYTDKVIAFEAYKEFKEQLLYDYGETYYERGLIPKNVGDALCSRKVNIYD